MINLGEAYLRAKVNHYTEQTFHRVDSQMVYLAIKDVLRVLDELRAEEADPVCTCGGPRVHTNVDGNGGHTNACPARPRVD